MSILLFLTLAAQTAAQAPPPPPEKKICRREVATGSIMPKRTCRTQGEWAQIDAATRAAAQRDLDDRNNRSMSTRQ